ncbi:MAG TPA: S53 family peptidase [Actinocrinis sp.]|nr:S53 family peptidase [Actinocrinis sp.]
MNKSSSAAAPEELPSAHSRRIRRAAIPAVAVSLAVGASQVALATTGHAAGVSRVAVGVAPTVPHGARAVAAPADSTKLTIDIQLKTPTSAQLPALAAAVNNPKSPSYHHFLAKGEIAKQFGASADEVAAVDAALRAAGLTPGPVSSDGLFIPVAATVGQAKAAFSTNFAGYKFGSHTAYANTTAPKFDPSISADIAGVVGLDNIAYAVPHYVNTKRQGKAASTSSTVKSHASVTPKFATPTCSNINSIFGAQKLQAGTDYYTADMLATIYGTSPVLAGGDNGSGVTVAVFELENYDTSGVNDLKSCYGISTSVTEKAIDSGPTAVADLATGVGLESALDIENIATLAPGVSIVDYAGPDYTQATDAQILDTYHQIVADDTAKVVSTSWGLCEAAANQSTITAEKTIFATAASQGQTVIAASGDAGSTDCYDPQSTTPDSELSVDDPASQPQVLAAGGTSMHNINSNSVVQSAWNSVQTDSQGNFYYGATGGGVSKSETQPSYQQGIAASGYTANCSAASGGCRQVPDVAALADPANGYVIDEYASSGPQGAGDYYVIIGGTSGAAPVWAAIYALADASSSCQANGAAGQAAPALYQAAATPDRYSLFRDVTAGNNGISAYKASYSYPATAGYDMATGWGTPVATGIITAACHGAVESTASYYVPDGPQRILNTRVNLGANGPVPANGVIKLQVTGANDGVPTSNVSAVAINVTVTQAVAGGDAIIWPDGSPQPITSNLNWSANHPVPNLVVVPVGADGKIDIINQSSGHADFIGDLAGYFTTDGSGTISTYNPVGPVRAMDTRNGTGVPQAPLPASGTLSLPIGGKTIGGAAIPSGITAVALNVTVVRPAAGGDLIVYPNQTASGTPVTRPTVSNLNFAAGQIIANMVIVPVGADGKVDFFEHSSGSTNVIADVAGYFLGDKTGQVYHAVGPDRIVDTKTGLGTATAGTLAANATLNLPIPADATAILANLTVASPTAGGNLTAYPSTLSSVPPVSNLNWQGGQQAVPNLGIVRTGGAGVKFVNQSSGSIRLIVDLGGYFSAN